ncbi:MAG: aldo/keto reductase [Alphaproteobacteria bacterium]|nr:aldo/keto reductase [Alphaproteobacteria bacterium]MBF0249274.1 aldo/keto reductase [Alphaproteobacteria bacterium]
MRHRALGKTGLTVSEVGMGTWPLAGALNIAGRPFGYGEVSEDQALATIKQALDGGVTLFDTADFYGLGRAEHYLGAALATTPEAQIVTKAGYIPDGRDGTCVDVSREHLIAALKRSLKRLKREAVDIFLVHVVPTSAEAWQGASEALSVMKREGLARHTGLSVAASFDNAAPYLDDPTIEVVEVYYNLFFNRFADTIHAQVRERNLGVLVASPFGRGILSNAFDATRRYGDDDVRRDWSADSPRHKADLDRRARVEDICARNGVKVGDAALSFSLALDGVSCVIPGMRTAEHVAANLAFANGPAVSDTVLTALQAASEAGT